MKKKPEAGQWWLHNNAKAQTISPGDHTVFFCGHNAKGELLFEDVDGHVVQETNLDWSHWHHEPACTGWDWVPEMKEEFPQWYLSHDWKSTAYVKRINEESAIRVDVNGVESEDKFYPTLVRTGDWYKTTQADAEARITKKPTDLPVVEAKKTASVTVYEVVYGDDPIKMHHGFTAREDFLGNLRQSYKYVSVVSTKTVEVML